MLKRISNMNLTLVVNSKGAEIMSIQSKDNGCEYMWNGEKEIWSRHAPILFPIVGKLKDFTYTYGDEKYILMQHGFAKDMEFKIISEKSDELVMRLENSEDTLEYYPFKFSFEVRYKLEDNKVLSECRVTNLNTKSMPFSMGIHPGFRCPIDSKLNFSDYVVKFEKREKFKGIVLENSIALIKRKNFYKAGKQISLSHELFEKDALILENPSSCKVTLSSPKDFKKVTLDFPKVPYLGIWSRGNSQSFVCIEPWLGMSDFEDSTGRLEEKEGIQILLPYQIYKFEYAITIE